MRFITFLLYGSAAFFLSACGSSSNNVPDNEIVIQKSYFSVAISDAPMSGMQHVRMVLDELVMTDSNGQEHRFALQGVEFNLLDYQGMNSYMVTEDQELSPGEYHDVYFMVHQNDGNQGSWVENNNGRFDLVVENGHLNIHDFTIGVDEHLSMTMEIDLYRSLYEHDGYYQLHDVGIYSVDDRNMGHLIVEVDPLWIEDCEFEYADLMPGSGEFSHMAYLYPEGATALEHMADVSLERLDGLMLPIAVSPMARDNEGNWHFEMGYLGEGIYNLGYTCLGHLDDPQTDDMTNGQFSMYRYGGETTVVIGEFGGNENGHQFGNGHGGGHGG